MKTVGIRLKSQRVGHIGNCLAEAMAIWQLLLVRTRELVGSCFFSPLKIVNRLVFISKTLTDNWIFSVREDPTEDRRLLFAVILRFVNKQNWKTITNCINNAGRVPY